MLELITFQAVLTGDLPTNNIPTDDEWKICSKRLPKPPKEEVVKKRKSRF
jgi:hypothetical protein